MAEFIVCPCCRNHVDLRVGFTVPHRVTLPICGMLAGVPIVDGGLLVVSDTEGRAPFDAIAAYRVANPSSPLALIAKEALDG